METVLAAAISAIAAMFVCLINGRTERRKTLEKVEELNTMQQYRIEQLEKKVDKHNNLIERTYRLEQSAALQDEKIKEANHRIEELQNKKG